MVWWFSQGCPICFPHLLPSNFVVLAWIGGLVVPNVRVSLLLRRGNLAGLVQKESERKGVPYVEIGTLLQYPSSHLYSTYVYSPQSRTLNKQSC